MARYIGAADTSEVIFTRGTTESINLVASSYGQLLREGDEIVLTVMEHHSNIVPWQLLEARRGVKIRVVPMDDRGVLDLAAACSTSAPVWWPSLRSATCSERSIPWPK